LLHTVHTQLYCLKKEGDKIQEIGAADFETVVADAAAFDVVVVVFEAAIDVAVDAIATQVDDPQNIAVEVVVVLLAQNIVVCPGKQDQFSFSPDSGGPQVGHKTPLGPGPHTWYP